MMESCLLLLLVPVVPVVGKDSEVGGVGSWHAAGCSLPLPLVELLVPVVPPDCQKRSTRTGNPHDELALLVSWA